MNQLLRLLLDDLFKTLRGDYHVETKLLAKVLAENIIRFDPTLVSEAEKKLAASPVRLSGGDESPFGL